MPLRNPRTVAALVATLLVANAVWNLLLNTLLVRSGLAAAVRVTYDVALPLSGPQAVAGLALSTVATIALFTALARTFSSDAFGGAAPSLDTALVYGRALVVAVGGTVAVALGLVALVVPGLVVALHLPLVFVSVAVDGDSVGQAVDGVWERMRGHRARVTAVGLAVVAIPLALAVIATLTTLLTPVAELAVGVVITTLAATVGLAVFTAIAESLGGTSAGSSRTGRLASGTSRQL
ncbi:hypothetical protein [Haloplanus halobius]|uniref:hypothetical protein n=1 Tax=Haloplanus halobius TaxID=2934938 RepID=UPI00200E4E9D|nr:hypothetical protein [Haloplanus sp. XH21]